MPVRRGKKITDARPQSGENGVGSLPLSALATANTMRSRGGRVMATGVEGVAAVQGSTETVDVAPSIPGAEHFEVPGAVLQRIQLLRQGQALAICSLLAGDVPSSQHGEDEQMGGSAEARPLKSVAVPLQHSHGKGCGTSEASVTPEPALSPASLVEPRAAGGNLMAEDDEVSEADVLATVAAHKTASSHATNATAAQGQKPIIFSRQWRRNLFASTPALSSASAATAASSTSALYTLHKDSRHAASRPSPRAEEVLETLRQHAQRCEGNDETDNNRHHRGKEEEDDDDALSPFGRSEVIKFARTEAPNSARLVRRFSGDAEQEDDSNSPGGVAFGDNFRLTQPRGPEDLETGATVPGGSLTRRQQLALRRQRAQQARAHDRIRQHMTGFETDYLKRHEAQLLRQEESAEEVEEEEDELEEDSTFSGNTIGSEEEEEEGDESTSGSSEYGEAESSTVAAPAPRHQNGETRSGVDSGLGVMERALPEPRAAQGQTCMNTAAAVPTAALVPAAGTAAAAADATPAAPASASPEEDPACLRRVAHNAGVGARSQFMQSFFFAVHENPLRSAGGCHHTLVGLRGPVTIKGPCGLIGFGLGEVSVNGFFLGRKQINLWHEDHRAVILPVRRLKSRNALDMELPRWRNGTESPVMPWPPGGRAATRGGSGGEAEEGLGGVPLQPLHFIHRHPRHSVAGKIGATEASDTCTVSRDEDEEQEEAFLQPLHWNCEAVFGEVDWDWVEATVQNWRGALSNQQPPIILVVQPPSAMSRRGGGGPMRKYFFASKRGRHGCRDGDESATSMREPTTSDAYMDIPSFFAHRSEPVVDLALLPSIVPAVAAQGSGCIMVLGSANIGKSTLCRFLANVLLSQYGRCYWLDLDVGQPEFGVPGQFSLSLVRRPLLRTQDSLCADVELSFFIGASTAVRCPLTTANALAAICAHVASTSREHPVVVNTHGWVLQTGRRVSVEALRRLRPRQVIHLCQAGEEMWAKDTTALLDPRNGLNAEVVQRRFLVRRGSTCSSDACKAGSASPSSSSKKNKSGKRGMHPDPAASKEMHFLCRLPYPHERQQSMAPCAAVNPQSPSTFTPDSPTTTTTPAAKSRQLMWRGQVHSVDVKREETYSSIEKRKQTKGSRGRQERWQAYFAPLLRHYSQTVSHDASPSLARQRDRSTRADTATTEEEEEAEKEEKHEEATTTLLEAPLSALHSIVMAERDEKFWDVPLLPPMTSSATEKTSCLGHKQKLPLSPHGTHAAVAAALEHAVVAVLFHASRSSVSSSARHPRGCMVRSLATLPHGFPVSCYGVVESGEQELLHGRRDDVAGSAAAAAAPPPPPSSCEATGSAGWIRIRVPLRPSVVAAMMKAPFSAGQASPASDAAPVPPTSEAGDVSPSPAPWTTNVSIAYSAALRSETAFVDVW